MKEKGSGSPGSEEVSGRLVELRTSLLNLHKTLVEAERVTYEKTVGEIKSANHFLQLLISDPWFAWLHPLSQMVVSMDEALNGEKPLTAADLDVFVKQAGVLLTPSEQGHEFSGHYFEALQSNPDVVMAHAEVIKFVGRRKAS